MKKLSIYFILFLIIININNLFTSDLWDKLFYQYNRDFFQAEVFDSAHCVALGETIGFFISRLIKTTDGGNSWESILKDEDVFLDPETRGGKIKVNCISYYQKECIALGCDTGRILITSNGGKHWKRIELGTKRNVKSISLTSEGKGYCITENSLYKTSDSGHSWNRLSLPFGVKLIDKVFCFDSNNTIVHLINTISNRFVFVRTTNGGVSWESSNINKGGTCNDLFFINDSIGWAVHYVPDTVYMEEYDYIIKTTNGGINWFEVLNVKNKPYKGLNSVHFIDENIGFASGKSGKLYFSEDGGITWKRVFCSNVDDTLFDIQKVRFLTKTQALAFSSMGFIYKWDKNKTFVSDLNDGCFYEYNFNYKTINLQIKEILLREAAVSLFDIHGIEVFNTKSQNQFISIDIRDYPVGLYLLRLSFNDKNYFIKLFNI